LTKGTLLVIVATLIFGFMGIAAKYIQASPVILLYSMQISGLIVILIILLKTRQFSPKNYVKLIIVMSFFGLLTDFFFFSAVKLTSVPNSVFVRYTAPIFILILMPFIIKEKIERKSIYAIPIALVGLFIILYQGNLTFDTNMTGMIFALLSAVTNASALVLVKKIMLKLNVYTMMFYRFLINTIILTPFILIGSCAKLHRSSFRHLLQHFVVFRNTIDIHDNRRAPYLAKFLPCDQKLMTSAFVHR